MRQTEHDGHARHGGAQSSEHRLLLARPEQRAFAGGGADDQPGDAARLEMLRQTGQRRVVDIVAYERRNDGNPDTFKTCLHIGLV